MEHVYRGLGSVMVLGRLGVLTRFRLTIFSTSWALTPPSVKEHPPVECVETKAHFQDKRLNGTDCSSEEFGMLFRVKHG